MSHLNHYQLLLFKLKQDLDRLRGVESHLTKAEMKRKMLPTYMLWVAGVLLNGSGVQDTVLMRVLVWLLDVGDLKTALDIAEYAIRYDLVVTDGFSRSTTCMIAEEVAAAAQYDSQCVIGYRATCTRSTVADRSGHAGQSQSPAV